MTTAHEEYAVLTHSLNEVVFCALTGSLEALIVSLHVKPAHKLSSLSNLK